MSTNKIEVKVTWATSTDSLITVTNYNSTCDYFNMWYSKETKEYTFINDNFKRINIPDLTNCKEEELFQMELVNDIELSVYVIKAVQGTVMNLEYSMLNTNHIIEY